MPHLRGAPVHLLPLEACGRPSGPGDAAPARAPAALDAQPAADGPRGADHRILAWAPRPGSQADLCPASTTRVGRAGRLSERGLEGAGAPRDQHARQAPGADRRLPSSLSAARRAPARAAHRRAAPGRARRRGLLLRRTPTRASTTTSALTPDGSPTERSRLSWSTVPGRWSRDEPQLSAYPGVCSV